MTSVVSARVSEWTDQIIRLAEVANLVMVFLVNGCACVGCSNYVVVIGNLLRMAFITV